MKILWFARLYADIDRFHLTTWREMGRCLREQGHEVQIALAGPGAESEPGFFPVPASRHSGFRMVSFWRAGRAEFRRRMRDFDPDAVILDVYTFWFAGGKGRGKTRPRIILDNRTPVYHASEDASAIVRALFKPYLRRCYTRVGRSFSGVTAINEFYRNLLVREYGFDPATIGVWGSGFDPVRFFPGDGRKALRPSEGKGRFVILQHGELSWNRGLLESVEAMRFVKSADVVLHFVGDGPARPALQALVDKYALGDKVFLKPAVPYGEIPDIIRSADCGLMAYPAGVYWNANNPIKLLEYLACGKPVIVTAMDTFRSVLGERGRAVVIDDNAPARIAAGIDECRWRLGADPEWGRENAVLARADHTWARQAERLAEFLSKVRP